MMDGSVSSPIRVIVADDHPIVLTGIQACLSDNAHTIVVGTATTFGDVIALLATTPADVLILDLSGMQGAPLTAVSRIRRDYPQVAIVVFSSIVDLAPELVQAGVMAYIVKEDLSGQLLHAIYAAYCGTVFVSTAVRDYLDQIRPLKRRAHLAPKEISVLKLLAQGLGTVEIAEQLGIDPRTAQNYVTALRNKTGCVQRIQLVDWYRRVCAEEENSVKD